MFLSFIKYCSVHKIFDRTSFSLANVSLLATSVTGTFPIDACNRSIADPSSNVYLECPLSCDSVLENVATDTDASNDCSGFGSVFCSDYVGWIDEYGIGCDVYETFDRPGCPYVGNFFPNEDGIAANDACCYCGGGVFECNTCFNTTDAGCKNDVEWTAIIDNETILCDWFEENDGPGCSNTYLQFLTMDNVSDPRESCCYCSEYGCQDLYEWEDVRYNGYGYGLGRGCYWYEKWDEPGCPKYGDKWSDTDGITAREACCHCRGYDRDSAPPACYDYNGWLDSYGEGCDWYEASDDPGCPFYGDNANENNITANDACC